MNHGGARRGAGRPLKWTFADVLKVGQACEAEWRKAAEDAVQARLAALPNSAQIRALHEGVQQIPIAQRRAWLASEAFEEHAADIESLIHDRVGTPFDEETATFARPAPRGVSVSDRPPRGTRKKIIAAAAAHFDLSASAIDNLWQEYRRFEREPLETRDSAET